MIDDTNSTELLSDDRAPAPEAPRTRVVISTTAEGAARLRAAFAAGELGHLGIVAIEAASAEDERPAALAAPTEAPPSPTLRDVWGVLANAANAAARLSRRPGAPVLSADSPRKDLIAWLQWNDPNGDYEDPYVWCEGPDGLFDEGWRVNVPNEPSRGFGLGASAEREARAYAAEFTSPIGDLWELLAAMDLEDAAGVKATP